MNKEAQNSIFDLLKRVAFTLVVVGLYRCVSKVLLPGTNVDLQDVPEVANDNNNFLSILNRYAGGSFQASILYLGIGPYVSASIITQILFVALSEFKERRKSDPSIVNRWTRLLSFPIALIQATIQMFTLLDLDRSLPQFSIIGKMGKATYFLLGVMTLITGSYGLVFLADMINQYGIGNGSSILISSSIIGRLTSSVNALSFIPNGIPILLVLIVIVSFFVTTVELLYRDVAVIFPSPKTSAANAAHIPFKINQNGVLAPIVAQNLFSIITFLYNKVIERLPFSFNFRVSVELYDIMLAFVIVGASFVFLEINLNPEEISDNLHSKPFSVLQSVRPGNDTLQYIDSLTKRLCMLGSIYIIIVQLIPSITGNLFFGGLPARILGLDLLIVLGSCIEVIQIAQTYFIPIQEGLKTLGQQDDES